MLYSHFADTASTQQALLRSISCDGSGSRANSEWQSSFLGDIVKLTKTVLLGFSVHTRLERYTSLGETLRLADTLKQVDTRRIMAAISSMLNRRIFISNEFCGLAPNTTGIGDLICILFGCSCPVVLRPRHHGYIFIGDAYVDGIMDGEAMNGYENGTYELQNFNLH